jgi:hypothetical protein
MNKTVIDTIMLTSPDLTVIKINRKTKAQMFKNLKVGDKIQFYVPIKYAGRNRGTYATYITAKNLETGESTQNSFNQISSILDAFEFGI